MMKGIKAGNRILSLVLALALILPAGSAGAFANEVSSGGTAAAVILDSGALGDEAAKPGDDSVLGDEAVPPTDAIVPPADVVMPPVQDSGAVPEELPEELPEDDTADRGGKYFEKPTVSTIKNQHIKLAISTSDSTMNNEPCVRDDGDFLFAQHGNSWGVAGYGCGEFGGGDCYTTSAVEVLSPTIISRLKNQTNPDGRSVWGHTDRDGIQDYLNAGFKNGTEKELIVNYLKHQNIDTKNANQYKINWYVAKYQSNDMHWHMDGILVKKDLLSVAYDANCDDFTGALPPTAINIEPGDKHIVEFDGVSTVKRDGYTFEGWNTKSDGSGSAYKKGDSFGVWGNTTLYAQWKQIPEFPQYNAVFKLYVGSTSGELLRTEQKTYSFNDLRTQYGKWRFAANTIEELWGITVTENDLVNPMADWSSAPKIEEQTYEVNMFVKPSAGIFREISFKNAVGGTLNGGDDKTYSRILVNTSWAESGIAVPVPVPEVGYAFMGWSEKAGGEVISSARVASDNPNIVQNHTYTAVYKETEVEVTFTVDSFGTLNVGDKTEKTFTYKVRPGQSLADAGGVVPTPVADDGYYFTGWTNESGIPVTPDAAAPVTTPQTYKAHFARATQVLTLTPESAEVTYNGKEQTVSGFKGGEGLTITKKTGEALTASATGTNAREYTTSFNAKPDEVSITKDGKDITSRYSLIRLETGKLTVNPLAVTVTTGDSKKIYDADPLTVNADATATPQFISGDVTSIKAIGKPFTNVGKDTNELELIFRDDAAKGNYEVKEVLGTLEVTKRDIYVETSNETAVYDRKDHSGGKVKATGLASKMKLHVISDKYLIDAGSVENKPFYKICLKGDSTNTALGIENFNFKEKFGTLTVTPRPVTITAGSASKTYDGTALTSNEFTTTKFDANKNVGFVEYRNLDGKMVSEGIESVVAESEKPVIYKGDSEANKIVSFEHLADTKLSNYEITKGDGRLSIIDEAAKPITITANSASKVYDGTVLTEGGFTLTSGALAAGDKILAVTESDKTFKDAGDKSNVISADVKVMNGTKDVSAYYEITRANGTLTITQRPVTITLKDASKPYDGTPLTAAQAGYEISKYNEPAGTGFIPGEGIVTPDLAGEITVPTFGAVTSKLGQNSILIKDTNWSNYAVTSKGGTLTITEPTEKRDLTFTAGSASKTYDGTALTSAVYGFDAALLYEGDAVKEVLVEGSAIDVKDTRDNNVVTSVKIMHGDDDVSDMYNIVKKNGTLAITPKAATVTANSTEGEYTGKPLTANGVTTDGFIGTQGVTAVVEGSITLPGTTDNVVKSYRAINGTDINNYAITTANGTLTVTEPALENKRAVTVTAESASKTYDGTELTAGGAKQTAGLLLENHKITMSTAGAITDYTDGGVPNVPTANITDENGNDVTKLYNITYVNGTLTIDKRDVTIMPKSATRAYNGAALTAEELGYDLAGAGFAGTDSFASVRLLGSQTMEGTAAGRVESYELAEGVNAANYNILATDGVLTITNKAGDRMPLYLTAGSASKTYDGAELRENSFKAASTRATKLHGGDKITEVLVSGVATNVFDSKDGNNFITSVKITNADGADVTGYYDVTVIAGTLAVLPRDITVTGNSGTFAADGKEHAVQGVTAAGLAEGYTIGANGAVAARTDVGTTAMGLTAQSGFYAMDAQGNTAVGTADNTYIKNYNIKSVTDGYVTITEAIVPPVDPSNPGGNTPGGNTPGGDNPGGGNTPGGNTPGGNTPGGNTPGGGNSGGNNPGGNTTPGDITRELTPTVDLPAAVVTAPEAPALPAAPTPVAPAAPIIAPPAEIIPENAVPAAQAPNSNGMELEEIADTEVPLASGGAWALVNLLLAAATVLGSLMLLIFYFTKKKAKTEAEEDKTAVRRHGIARIASLVPAIGAVVMFALTENMNNPMIYTDKWTLFMAAIAVLQVAVMVLARKKYEDDEQDDEQTPAMA